MKLLSFLTAALISYGGFAASIPNYKNIYISGTPTEQTLKNFKKTKGAVVLDLRSIDELGNCSEPAAATKLGLEYRRVGVEKGPTLAPDVIAGIDEVIKSAGKKPVLLFCKTGNRASAWLTVHLVRDEKIALEDAFRMTRPMGLKADMESAVRTYLSGSSTTTSSAPSTALK